MAKNKYPVCFNGHPDCFAYFSGECVVLDDTHFGKKGCPFYKTVEQAKDGKYRSYFRLMRIGRKDLIDKYSVYLG